MRVESPSKQHARAAEKILERRAKANSNEVPEDEVDDEELETQETLEDSEEVGGVEPDTDAEEDTEEEDPYQDMGRKQLKMLCDRRVPKLVYKAKATKPQLIALLKAEV